MVKSVKAALRRAKGKRITFSIPSPVTSFDFGPLYDETSGPLFVFRGLSNEQVQQLRLHFFSEGRRGLVLNLNAGQRYEILVPVAGKKSTRRALARLRAENAELRSQFMEAKNQLACIKRHAGPAIPAAEAIGASMDAWSALDSLLARTHAAQIEKEENERIVSELASELTSGPPPFTVTCDETNNTPEDLAEGRVNVSIDATNLVFPTPDAQLRIAIADICNVLDHMDALFALPGRAAIEQILKIAHRSPVLHADPTRTKRSPILDAFDIDAKDGPSLDYLLDTLRSIIDKKDGKGRDRGLYAIEKIKSLLTVAPVRNERT